MASIKLQPCQQPPITAGYIGSVKDVISGHVPQSLAHQRFQAKDYQYGYELASVVGLSALGEALIVNGFCFATATDKESPEYMQTVSGHDFVTTGVFLIPKEAKPTYHINMQLDAPCVLYDFYSALYQKIKQPFAFAAFFSFKTLHATAIAKPPVYGENVFDHKKSYYPFPEQDIPNQYAFLVGTVADFNTPKAPSLLQTLEVVLYHNPFEQKGALTTHAHGVTLNRKVSNIHEITPQVVDETLHIFAKHSMIHAVFGEIFVLRDIKNMHHQKV